MPRKPKPLPPREPTADDVRMQRCRDAAAKSLARWFKQSLNINRPIASLSRGEMTAAAECAAMAYQVEESWCRANIKPLHATANIMVG